MTNAQGTPVQSPKAKLISGENFYAQLYATKSRDPVAANQLLSAVPEQALLSDAQQQSLGTQFTLNETEHVITQRLGTGKAPGPDGLPNEL